MGYTRTTPAGSMGWRRKLVVVPLLCLGLAASAPAQANPPDVQGTACSGGKEQSTLPGPALEAPQSGRPAGIQGGRKV